MITYVFFYFGEKWTLLDVNLLSKAGEEKGYTNSSYVRINEMFLKEDNFNYKIGKKIIIGNEYLYKPERYIELIQEIFI